MDIKEYKQTLHNEIEVNAIENMYSTRESFLAYVADYLIEVGEIQEINECYFSSTGKRGKKILIDGYFYCEMMRELYLVVANYEQENFDKTLVKSQIDTLFNGALAFLENKDLILEKGEEATRAYQFAEELKERYWKSLRKIKIIVVSNQEIASSKKLINIESAKFSGVDVVYSIWGVERLYEIASSNLTHENIVIDLKDFGIKGIHSIDVTKGSGDYGSYLSVVPGDLIAELYNKYGAKLLEGNVRSYLQNRGKVNRAIRETLLKEPDMFFAYNNGIAGTASSVEVEEVDGETFITKIENFQIVNGGQTAASIFNVKYVERLATLKDVYLPMKLAVVKEDLAEKLIPIISRTSNTQNKVSEADFFSNHPFHVRIEQISKKVYAPEVGGNQFRTRWMYERARGQYRSNMMKMSKADKNKFERLNPKKQVITKTDLAKYYNSLGERPHLVSKGAQNNFLNFAKDTNKKWQKSETVFNNNYYIRIVCIAILFKKIEKIISSANWYQNAFRANIVTYSISRFYHEVRRRYPNHMFDFQKIWKAQHMSPLLVKTFEKLCASISREITKEAVGRTKNITEWCKKADCWEEVKRNVEVDLEGIKEFLVEKGQYNNELKEAKSAQRIANKINLQIEAVNKGAKFWKDVFDWGTSNGVLFSVDRDIVKKASEMDKTGKPPSEKQAKRLFEIIQNLEKEGLNIK